MKFEDYLIIIALVVLAIAAALYFFNKRATKKLDEAQTLINQSKQMVSIFVIDKKHDKAENVNLPKVVIEQIPKWQKFRKMYFVKAKIGAQIVTLICDKPVYMSIPIKKNIKIYLAGIFIVEAIGFKPPKDKSIFGKAREAYYNRNAK